VFLKSFIMVGRRGRDGGGGGKGSPTVSGSLLLHQRPTVVLKVLRGLIHIAFGK